MSKNILLDKKTSCLVARLLPMLPSRLFFLFGWRGCSLLVACAVTVCVVTLACAGVSVLGGKGVAFPCYSFYSFSAILNCAIAALYLSRFCLCFSVLVLFCSLILRHCCVVLVQILLVLFCACAFLFCASRRSSRPRVLLLFLPWCLLGSCWFLLLCL